MISNKTKYVLKSNRVASKTKLLTVYAINSGLPQNEIGFYYA